MHRVLEHIDRQLDQVLDLSTLAVVAHIPPFHFHRLFCVWTGETPGDYVSRRRIEVAAMRLAAQPGAPVLHIALSVGFSSVEAFARAFRGRFGCSRTSWKKQQVDCRSANRNPGQTNSNPGQARTVVSANHAPSRNATTEVFMNVKLIDRQPSTIAYLRYLGLYG